MSDFDWDSIKDIIPDRSAKPPAQCFTLRDFAKNYGVSKGSAEGTLETLVGTGKLKVGSFWSPALRRMVNHYWKPEDEPQ